MASASGYIAPKKRVDEGTPFEDAIAIKSLHWLAKETKSFHDFKLGVELQKDAGKFDDVVIGLQQNLGDKFKYNLIQIRHGSTRYTLHYSDMVHRHNRHTRCQKHTFCLKVYFESYQKVKENHQQGEFKDGDLETCVILTNKSFDPKFLAKIGILTTVSTVSVVEKIHPGTYFKFPESQADKLCKECDIPISQMNELKEFLTKFAFSGNQQSQEQIISSLKEELKEEYGNVHSSFIAFRNNENELWIQKQKLFENKNSFQGQEIEHMSANQGTILKLFTNTKDSIVDIVDILARRPKRIGPLKVVVKPAARLRTEQEGVYKMTKKSRGRALIINIKHFPNDPEKERVGSETDVNNLEELFTQLGFSVTVVQDLTGVKIKEKVKTFSSDKEANSESQMFILVAMSHGNKGHFLGSDESKVHHEKLLKLFHNKAAVELKGKPKLFIFAHCRGEEKDFGVPGLEQDDFAPDLEEDDIVSELEEDAIAPENIPTWEDMFIVHATVPGYSSKRSKVHGVWLIECMCEAFMNYACDFHLVDLLTLVKHYLRKKESKEGKKQSFEYIDRHMLKYLYFNPGLSDEN